METTLEITKVVEKSTRAKGKPADKFFQVVMEPKHPSGIDKITIKCHGEMQVGEEFVLKQTIAQTKITDAEKLKKAKK